MKLDMDEYAAIYKEGKSKGPFIHRDISWLEFNRRVLACSLKPETPMNERLNFLGITSSNLDEFISVRFAAAIQDEDENTKKLLDGIKKFKKDQNGAFQKIKEDIKKKFKMEFVKPDELSKEQRQSLQKMFRSHILPLLNPMDITGNDINLVSGMTYVTTLLKRGAWERLMIIPLIDQMDNLYQIGHKILLLEDIVIYYLDQLFINQELESIGVFRVIKDSSVLLSHDESRFIVDRMNDTLQQRSNASPLFLELKKGTDEDLEELLISKFKIPTNHWYKSNLVGNFKIFSKEKIFDKKESYEPFVPFRYENHENYYSIFDAISHEDILLQHPYDSYETVIKFLEHAATDPDVITICQTLYRVSGIDSPIVKALCKARECGKHVIVLVEIKARFDESNNIRVLEILRSSGVNVIFGNEFLKTHCKMCLVTRRENGQITIYSHVATGNYNEKTSRIYTDLSYFTARQKIGIDLLGIFNILSGHSRPNNDLQKVFYAPVNLRSQLEKCFDKEIALAKDGKKPTIFIKVNSISDVKICNKIYEAARAGVKVDIICRGTCSLVPIKNLTIKSVVGRFLEHSRIYYFEHTGYYISSADLLSRNLDRRVETLISIKDAKVEKQLKWIISVLKQDEVNSFIEQEDGSWKQAKGNFDAHEWMIEYSDIKKKKKGWN